MQEERQRLFPIVGLTAAGKNAFITAMTDCGIDNSDFDCGDYMRARRKTDKAFDDLVKKEMSSGDLCGSGLINSIIEQKVKSVFTSRINFLSGFCRKSDQTDFLLQNECFDKFSDVTVIFIDTPVEVCRERSVSDAADRSDREDGSLEVFEHRLEVYRKHIEPEIIRLSKHPNGIGFIRIDGSTENYPYKLRKLIKSLQLIREINLDNVTPENIDKYDLRNLVETRERQIQEEHLV